MIIWGECDFSMLIKDKIKVGSFELRNRMVKAPIHSETCVDGKVTPETEQHYEERTKAAVLAW